MFKSPFFPNSPRLIGFVIHIHYSCLRNAVSMFHVIEKEMRWRKDNGRPEGFDALKKSKPIVAVGADEPLGGERMKAAYYREYSPYQQLSSSCLITMCMHRWSRRPRRCSHQRMYFLPKHPVVYLYSANPPPAPSPLLPFRDMVSPLRQTSARNSPLLHRYEFHSLHAFNQ